MNIQKGALKIMVELREITKDNLEDVLSLKVSVTQSNFVSTTAHSLAQAYVYRKTAYPFAIYAGDTMVGFIMLGYYEVKNQYTLWKLLIDKRYQNKGYGKAALQLGINYLVSHFKVKEIFTGVRLENNVAKNLYQSFGFKETGYYNESQVEMKLDL